MAEYEDIGPQRDAGARLLIAGVGNIFLGDDAFGVEVAKRLTTEDLPDWVRVEDFGIRGIHFAFHLLEHAYETTILVDATARGGEPGTVYLIEPDLESLDAEGGSVSAADAHGMTPEATLRLVRAYGGNPGRLLLVGCEPAHTGEEMGLSAPVTRAVEEAVTLIRDIVQREVAAGGNVQHGSLKPR
ncbi:MAG: hydrogenase maturation protease [Gemmatimonadaceae bacterium]